MTVYSLTTGSGKILLSTEWNQDSPYNDFCPIDPSTKQRSYTGCTNTAAAQILYYWIEHGLTLDLILTEADSYTSEEEGISITIDATSETASQNGYLSFAEVNQKLSDFTLGDVADIAALNFACGVVQEANYSSEGTSTAWKKALFLRAGMAGCSRAWFSSARPYFFDSSGEKIRITDAGYEILINELLSGRPVGASTPYHALIFDGYDSDKDTFHINFGWGGYQNGWYTRDQIYEMQFNDFCFDLLLSYDGSPILVTNSDVYGVGTFLRGIEQLQGIFNANTLTVQTDVEGARLELQRSWVFEKDITINHFNSEVRFTDDCCIYSTESLTVNDFSGSVSADGQDGTTGIGCDKISISDLSGSISAISQSSYAYGIHSDDVISVDNLSGSVFAQCGGEGFGSALIGGQIDVQNLTGNCLSVSVASSTAIHATAGLNLSLNDGRIFAGKLSDDTTIASLQQALNSYGASGIASAGQYDDYATFYAIYSGANDDVILVKNHASIQGSIYTREGQDTLSVLGGSYVYAPSLCSVETLTIDSPSTVSCVFYGDSESSMTVNLIITGETPSEEMIRLQDYYVNFNYCLKDRTLDVDLRAAEDGEYVLIDATGVDNAEYFSNLLSAKISTGSETFTLACGESANHVSLKYQSEKLLLVLDGYSSSRAEALLFDGEALLSVTESVCDTTLSETGTDSLRLTDGGTAQYVTIGEGGDLAVSNGGSASDTTVDAHGFFALNSGGKAVNTTVNNDGILNISDSAIHAGSLFIAEDAVVKAEDSATVDFTIAGLSAAAYQGINDLSRIDGTPLYTLSVSGEQGKGKYVLAGNAAAFDSTITVKGLTDTHFLNLADAKTFTEGKTTYTLSLNPDAELLLSVTGSDSVPPVITLTGDNENPRQSAILTATVDDGSDMEYSTDRQSWSLYTGAITVTANGTYFFRAEDEAGNVGYAEKTFTNILPSAPENPTGNKDGIAWSEPSAEVGFIAEYSTDHFAQVIQIHVSKSELDTLNLPEGTYQWRVKFDAGTGGWAAGNDIVSDVASSAPQICKSNANGVSDVFFVRIQEQWTDDYAAQHVGVGSWTGTEELASLAGKNRITDVFEGSEDANVLLLTDSENGDALFVDDVYSAFPENPQARIAQIDEIRAGGGDDLVDMTSQLFKYDGDGLTIRGGAGNDTIWSNKGDNLLFGDAGDDRLVGALGNDVFAGGSGNDSMQGGGGDDVFTFCSDWGHDTVEQLGDGRITLWFAEDFDLSFAEDGADTRISSSQGTILVKGFSRTAVEACCRYGASGHEKQYASLEAQGAFSGSSSSCVFGEEDRGVLISL